MLPSGGLFPTSYGTELVPLFPYLRAGLLKGGGGGGSRFGPVNRPLLPDYGLKGFLTTMSTQAWRKILMLVLFMSSPKSLVTDPPTKR